jgi:hypothetical protein
VQIDPHSSCDIETCGQYASVFGYGPPQKPLQLASKPTAHDAPAFPLPDTPIKSARPLLPTPWWENVSSATAKTVTKPSAPTNLKPQFEVHIQDKESLARIAAKLSKPAAKGPKKDMPSSSSSTTIAADKRRFLASVRDGTCRRNSYQAHTYSSPEARTVNTTSKESVETKNPFTKAEVALLESAELLHAKPSKRPAVSLPAPKPVEKPLTVEAEIRQHIWQDTFVIDREAARKAVERGTRTWAKPTKRLSEQIKMSRLPITTEMFQPHQETFKAKTTILTQSREEPSALRNARNESTDSSTATKTPTPPTKPQEFKFEIKAIVSIPVEEREQLVGQIHESLQLSTSTYKKHAEEKQARKPAQATAESAGRSISGSAQPKKEEQQRFQKTQITLRMPEPIPDPSKVNRHTEEKQDPAKQTQKTAEKPLNGSTPAPTGEEKPSTPRMQNSVPSKQSTKASPYLVVKKVKKSNWVNVPMPKTEAVKKEEVKALMKPEKTLLEKEVKKEEELMTKVEAEFEDLSLESDEEEGWRKVDGGNGMDEWEVVDELVG